MTAPNTVEKKTTKERKEILCTKHIFLNYIIKTTHFISAQFSSVTHSCPTLCDPMNRSTPGLLVPHQFPESTQTHVHWVGDAIQPFHPVMPFSSCPQSFPASGSFQMSQLFASGGPSIGVSASTSVLSMNTQDWSPLGWTGWISLHKYLNFKIHHPCMYANWKNNNLPSFFHCILGQKVFQRLHLCFFAQNLGIWKIPDHISFW